MITDTNTVETILRLWDDGLSLDQIGQKLQLPQEDVDQVVIQKIAEKLKEIYK